MSQTSDSALWSPGHDSAHLSSNPKSVVCSQDGPRSEFLSSSSGALVHLLNLETHSSAHAAYPAEIPTAPRPPAARRLASGCSPSQASLPTHPLVLPDSA